LGSKPLAHNDKAKTIPSYQSSYLQPFARRSIMSYGDPKAQQFAVNGAHLYF
jgi:hypothetical protein